MHKSYLVFCCLLYTLIHGHGFFCYLHVCVQFSFPQNICIDQFSRPGSKGYPIHHTSPTFLKRRKKERKKKIRSKGGGGGGGSFTPTPNIFFLSRGGGWCPEYPFFFFLKIFGLPNFQGTSTQSRGIGLVRHALLTRRTAGLTKRYIIDLMH